jgi:dihydroxyacid dehydratase/phosphogluconate dehydratase
MIMADPGRTRSAQWFDRQDIGGFIHRAFTKGSGFTPEDMGRPLIGIAQTWSGEAGGVAGRRLADGVPDHQPEEVTIKPTSCSRGRAGGYDDGSILRR